jgi:hypothetical protein
MKVLKQITLFSGIDIFMLSCATSGPKYSEMGGSIPSFSGENGRIYITEPPPSVLQFNPMSRSMARLLEKPFSMKTAHLHRYAERKSPSQAASHDLVPCHRVLAMC